MNLPSIEVLSMLDSTEIGRLNNDKRFDIGIKLGHEATSVFSVWDAIRKKWLLR